MTRPRLTAAQRRFLEAVAQRERRIREIRARVRFDRRTVHAAEQAGWIEWAQVWVLTPEGRAALTGRS